METVPRNPAAAADAAPAQNEATDEWLTVRESAAIARVSEKQIRAAVHRGELRAACVDGRGRLILHRAWIARWLTGLSEASVRQTEGRSAVIADFKAVAAGDGNEDGKREAR
jgi:excisionase family DNA binding protein